MIYMIIHMSCQKAIVVITRRVHCFLNFIYVILISYIYIYFIHKSKWNPEYYWMDIMCRRLNLPSIENPLYGHPTFYLFFFEPPASDKLLWQYCLNEICDKHKNKLIWQNYFFIFRRLKNHVTCFFISNTSRLRFGPK